MIILFFIIMAFCANWLFAAPLEGGFALAPSSWASPEEKSHVYITARLKVIEAAKKYEGTPYRFGGMSAAGMDCSGFLVVSFRDAIGVSLPRSAAGLYSWTERIPYNKAQPGDLLFFRTGFGGSITHVALYLGGSRFIHAASAGEKTGVIYSSLDEQYWIQAFAGAGRAFPESESFTIDSHSTNNSASTGINIPVDQTGSDSHIRINAPDISQNSGEGRLLAGAAAAPIWKGFIKEGDLIRGFASHLFLYADTNSFGPRMVLGVEIRPEYDGTLGVFRLPITFSWGPNENFRIFAGPVFSFGDASISTEDGERNYSGGTSLLGAVGLTAAPFVFNSAAGDFSPYIEMAWQSYFRKNSGADIAYEFSAGFRFSTGIRWMTRVR